jgi:hypothetical protein
LVLSSGCITGASSGIRCIFASRLRLLITSIRSPLLPRCAPFSAVQQRHPLLNVCVDNHPQTGPGFFRPASVALDRNKSKVADDEYILDFYESLNDRQLRAAAQNEGLAAQMPNLDTRK